MKIAIFGGAFNPPHIGHIQIVNQAIKQLSLDKMIILPTGQPPHKENFDKTKRFEMATLCFGELDKVEISDYEFNQDDFSYSYKTLKHFKDIYKKDELIFIIGGDSLRDFCTWKNPENIIQYASLCCVKRENIEFRKNINKVEKLFNTKIIILDILPDNISSTNLRLAIMFGLNIAKYVPQKVEQFIQNNDLYNNYDNIITKLKKMLPATRFLHTYYVCKEGLKLNEILKLDKEEVLLSCLLHDCAKYITVNDYANYGFLNNENYPEPVVHAFLGSLVAEKDFSIDNKNILNAIKYHTTGKGDMTKLEQLVYVADTIEESRPDNVDELRKTIYNNFDEGFIKCVQNNLNYVKKGHNQVCNLSEECLKFYDLGE